ncbi:MATE family efflux transporter [Oscillospiraceae bacterium OttesenSCG-928-F05]|nr:MATE family efflux transporter [Oscillospiraceae bacterium OttesenSCG-928-F05]
MEQKTLLKDKAFLKQLLFLALPLALQNLINSSLQLADTVMVGMLGQDSLSAVSLANTPFFVLMFFGFGLQSGGAVLISQYWGKRDITTINRVFGISVMGAVAVSLIVSTVIFIFPTQVMSVITDNPALVDIAARYSRMVAFSYVFNSFTVIYIGMHRSTENPRFGMILLFVSMFMNIFLNYTFIFGKFGAPAMGVEGAAFATLLSRIIEVCIVIVHMFVSKHIKLNLKAIFRPGMVIFRDYVKYATPVVINEVLWSLGVSLYPVIFGHMRDSSDIVAAYSISGNIERIVGVFSFAIAGSAAIMVGKAIGAGETKERVYKMGLTLNILSALTGVVTGLILLTLTEAVIAPVVYPIFNLTANATKASTTMLFIIAFFLPARYFTTTNVVGVWRGGGDVKSGMYLDTGTIYLYAVPLAAIAALVLKLDIIWVYLLISSEEIIKAALGVWRFRSKKWIQNITRDMPEVASET